MEAMVKIAATVTMLVVSLSSTSPALARQSVSPDSEGPPARFVTLHVDFGDDAGTYIRVREGSRATITLHDEGVTLALVPFVGAFGEVSVQVLSIENPGVMERVSLIETVILDQDREGAVDIAAEMGALRSPGSGSMAITLAEPSPGIFQAKANRDTILEPEENHQTSKQCCLTCNGRSYCGCEVETACGGYCCAWICCNLDW